ncbi:type II toxin-antitoxin system RelE/ParE family toxin [Aestuariirhabdus sp. Z084]|uniref:type II toxin-antitoxin system RelE/ParE family toxin n=1 Tax=Aestuariirhabdus haliotis TaxID=2918751 RepID=UPI00201B4083|nr:type II toxin-antitoxin system RelE/ParE family toxin [Aestuariirhabdus haliotis]MCL6415579.1 type II toxin-antitoxin system RelE/ParE family toxin [Aestuariirhabdus haliotis]MCL6419216.1 type II toxin-antitoxin system RelE/ParE family toxin [Aestuariirhabdus haliotis]
MSSFTLTNSAKNDLKAIAKFSEQHWGYKQRTIYIKQFDDSFHMLSETPSAGKDCNYIKAGYRKFPQGSHIIFYRELSNKSIQIVRILHKQMDVDSQLGNS